MEYIFFYSYQIKLGNSERAHGRYIREMKPGLTMLEMILEVEDYLKLRGPHWDYNVFNVIPNGIPAHTYWIC